MNQVRSSVLSICLQPQQPLPEYLQKQIDQQEFGTETVVRITTFSCFLVFVWATVYVFLCICLFARFVLLSPVSICHCLLLSIIRLFLYFQCFPSGCCLPLPFGRAFLHLWRHLELLRGEGFKPHDACFCCSGSPEKTNWTGLGVSSIAAFFAWSCR